MHPRILLPIRALLLLAAALMIAAAVPASATVLHYNCLLSGPAESPPNASPGTGGAEVTIDNVANTMRVQCTLLGRVCAHVAQFAFQHS